MEWNLPIKNSGGMCVINRLVLTLCMLTPISVQAGPFCDQFNAAPEEKHGTYILLIIDEMMKAWPQNEQMKGIMTDKERLSSFFKDAEQKMRAACNAGKDFVAGLALGEGIAVYKIALLKTTESTNAETGK